MTGSPPHRPEPPGGWVPGLADRVIAVVSGVVGARSIDAAAPWRSLGMDSLDLLSLVTALEDEFGIAIPDLVAVRLRHAGDVEEWLAGQLREAETNSMISR